jgi:hypothetical protein
MIFVKIYCISIFGNATQRLWSPISDFGRPTQRWWSPISDFGRSTQRLWSPISDFGRPTQRWWSPISDFGRSTQQWWSPISIFGNASLVKNCYMLIVFGKYFYLVCQRFYTLLFTHYLPEWGTCWWKLVLMLGKNETVLF